MKSEDDEFDTTRLYFLGVMIGVIMLIYTFYLFSLQIIKGNQYGTKAKNISQKTIRIPSQRGEIYDRTGVNPLVLNVDSFAVEVIPAEVPRDRFSTTIAELAKILEIPSSSIEKKLPTSVKNDFRTIEVASNVSYEKIVKLAERINDMKGVSWRSKPIRNYIETGSFSHITGYVGEITAEEAKILYNKGYSANALIGKAGIEKQYDALLRGKDGMIYRTVDASGRYIENTEKIEVPKMGKSLVLTIDSDIQRLVEKAVGERIGAAVVLKPHTGEVLALVSYPYFDQNIFIEGSSNSSYRKLLIDERDPLLNRVVNARYPPASTFKVIMSTAIINEKVFPTAKKVECPGEIKYGDRLFRCHIRKPGHGYLNLKYALVHSCDVYFWVVCRDYLGVDKIMEYAKRFGFGSSAEIDLPGQTQGFVPSQAWKERTRHEKWSHGDTMNISIGQGFMLASPLQVANVACMVLNDGIIYKPHLLKKIISTGSEKSEEEIEREVLRRENIPRKVFAQVREAMRAVIAEGEARVPMNNPYFKLAGKTGTAEVGMSDHWHSWMLSYGPYDAKVEDMVVVSVIIEAKNKWEWWAPYASNIILQGVLANQTFEEAVLALGFNSLPQLRHVVANPSE